MKITNDQEREQIKEKLVPFLLASAYVGVAANIQGIFALFPLIREDFDLSRAQAGLFSTFYFLSATAVAVFSGRLVDKLGARRGLLLGVSAVGLVMGTVALAPAYGMILALAFLCGLVFSVITPSVSRGIMEHVAKPKRAFAMGIAHSGSGIGGMLAAALLPILASAFGWRPALVLAALFALLTAGVIAAACPNETSAEQAGDEKNPASAFKPGVISLLGRRDFITVCLLGTLLGAMMGSATSHFSLFLHNDLQLSPAAAGGGLAAL